MTQNYFDEKDRKLHDLMEEIRLLPDRMPDAVASPDIVTREVHYPTSEYRFLHEAAIISFKGVLYTSWYNCHTTELRGRTLIRGRRSSDCGRTWSDVEVIADDNTAGILWCPPVYGIYDDRMWMFMNEMTSADHIHALDLFVLDEETGKFTPVWSLPVAFKLNTNVVTLSDGRLMLPGRVTDHIDGFPDIPVVMISDSGRIDAEWRLVKLQENNLLPDGTRLIHPEISPIVRGSEILMFCRDDERRVPLIYISHDCGETWSAPLAHDIPFCNAKIYSGTLSDGRNYVMGNIFPPDVTPEVDYPRRNRLAAFFSRPNTMIFDKGIIIEEDRSPDLLYGADWAYPVACEADGTLYVIYSSVIEGSFRGAALSAIDLKAL